MKAKLGESRSNILRIVEWIGKWCGVLVSGIADAWSAYPAFWVPFVVVGEGGAAR